MPKVVTTRSVQVYMDHYHQGQQIPTDGRTQITEEYTSKISHNQIPTYGNPQITEEYTSKISHNQLIVLKQKANLEPMRAEVRLPMIRNQKTQNPNRIIVLS